jgi:hypothetical protein
MATRMTVHQAADLWKVNRRTILKWIMGKDTSGRGKRLVEGQDYEIVDSDIPGRKMYVLLREEYPLTLSTDAIPKIARGRSPRAPEPTGTLIEQEVAAVEVEAPEVVTPKPAKAPTTRAPKAPKAKTESIRRDRLNAEIDELVEEDEYVEVPKPKARAPKPAPAPVEPPKPIVPKGSIREQIASWVEANPRALSDDMEDPTRAIARLITPDVAMEAGERGGMANLARRNQDLIERAIERVLASEPFSPDAKRFIGGKILEYLQRWHGFQPGLSSRGYWPITPATLSGLRGFGASEFEAPFPPYEWELA